MEYGSGMIRAPACRNWVGHILTLFAPRPQNPQSSFTPTLAHWDPPPGLVFGAPHLLGVLQGSRRVRGHFWCATSPGQDVGKCSGLETYQLREGLKPKSLFSCTEQPQSLKHPMGNPILPGGCTPEAGDAMEHLQVQKVELPSKCTGKKTPASSPGGLQDPEGCFGVCSLPIKLQGCRQDWEHAAAGARTMPEDLDAGWQQKITPKTPLIAGFKPGNLQI